MELFDRIKEEAAGFVTKVAGHGETGEQVQTVTIACAQSEVEALWRDPDKLSSVFGDEVGIRVIDGGVFEWTLSTGPDEIESWWSKLVDTGDSLRFVTYIKDAEYKDSDRGARSAELAVRFREAPNERGTELSLSTTSRLPAIFTTTFLFGALYRARALLQTGEVPTLAHNPSARDSAH